MPSSQGSGPEKRRKRAGNGADRGLAQQSGGRVFQGSPTGSAQDIHRAPPHSLEAEQGVLGSMLIAPQDVIPECVEKIKEEYFYVPAHQTVFRVLVEQWSAGQAIDLITFTQTLRDQNVLETIEKLYERRGGITGLSTGFIELDRLTSGLHPAEMVVIAGRPSMGKTALAMNMAEHVAVNQRKPVAVFSLEMSSQQLVQRMLCSRARVNLQRVRDGFLGERDFPSLTAAASKLADAKIFIDDSPSLEILELRAKARRLKAQQNVELVLIDYLQLLRSATRRAKENRQLEISEISAGLKALAKELNIPVIVVAQLNRQPEARSGGKPRLSDLRESGSIEQDADLVGLLVRPEIYEEDEEARAEKEGEAELIIAKQRNGPVGEIPLTFLKEFTRFEDRARNVREPGEAF